MRWSFLFFLLSVFACSKSDRSLNAQDGDTIQLKSSKADSLANPSEERVTYPFRLSINEGSNWDIQIDTIPESAFDQSKKIVYRQKEINGDSLLNLLAVKFKETILLTDSCCILKGWDKDLKMCRSERGDDREWTGYSAEAFEHGYLIMVEWQYEDGEFVSFNPTTRKYVYGLDVPQFITDDLIYYAGSYYNEGIFQINDLNRNRSFRFSSGAWSLVGRYHDDHAVLMEFTYADAKKYLKVNFSQ